tara:strand:- start:65 stop:1276 length:1212 start_codon:yes stop_codon:yes gene_type:complete
MNLENIPNHLKQYIVDQNYGRYTIIDHKVWSFIMDISIPFFKKYAHHSYYDGLKKTGISFDRIPSISYMNEKLSNFGWGAVAVRGFIPPWAFMEFQALAVLPIACDMRSSKHLTYTPAPDIVHESAGHSPIIINEEYSHYLKEYGRIASKAVFSNEDQKIYHAIRKLSDIKENSSATLHDIEEAEKQLIIAKNNQKETSEATLLSRLHWWTVEYGLVGSLSDPKIYGAGLLSSVGESQNCLSSNIKKIPLSIDCINFNYDITEQQPQLFVAKNFNQLTDVLHEFEKTMEFYKNPTKKYQKLDLAKDDKISELNKINDNKIDDEKLVLLYESFEKDRIETDKLIRILDKEYPDEWLLRFKIYEKYYNKKDNWLNQLNSYLTNYQIGTDMNKAIIRGVKLLQKTN